MKLGDLIGYYNIDGDIEYGIVVQEPYYEASYEDTAVDVYWIDDPFNGDPITKEILEHILSDDEDRSYIWRC